MNILALLLMILFQTSMPSLQGIVLKTGTREPVANATVELRRTDATDPRVHTVTTASDGRFVFTGVPSGQYQLAVQRIGYIRLAYGERRPGGPGTPIAIPAEQPDTQLFMTPTGVILGRILDARGQPLGNATVTASKTSYAQGRQSLSEVQSAITNDLGEYRLFWLTPGRYYVSATPTVGSWGIGSGGTDRVNEFRAGRQTTTVQPAATDDRGVAIYFPGTRDSLAAAAIDLKAGAEARNIDIVAAPVRARHIRGVIINGETGQAITGSATLRLIGTTANQVSFSPTTTFDIRGIIPGTFVLLAEVGNRSGKVSVEVIDRDVDNVTISVSPTFTLPGRILSEEASVENPGPDVKTLRISLRSEPLDGTFPAAPAIAADGTFAVPGLLSGTYRLSLNPVLQNAYVKSAKLGNTEVLQSGLTFRGPSSDTLVITVSTRPGTLEGRVLNDKNEPLPNAVVVLVPETALRSRSDLFRNVTTTAKGEFKLQGLTPGDYKLFSWEEVDNGAWLNADFMRQHEERGRPVRVVEGSRERVELLAVPN